MEQFTKYALSQKDLLPETLQDTVDDATGKINDIAVSAGSLLFKFIQSVFQGYFCTCTCAVFPCLYVKRP